MKKQKVVILSGILIIIAGVAIFASLSLNNLNKNTFTDSKSENIKEFFHKNTTLFNDIKNGLWSNEYSFATLDEDGFITVTNESGGSTQYWDDVISNDALEYFKHVEFPNPTIEFVDSAQNKTVEFLFYFGSNRMRVGIVYSESDLSGNDFYERIQDNWYFVQQGMT